MKVMRCLEVGKPSREELEAQRRRELAHRKVAQREREAWARPANPQQPGTLRAGAPAPAPLARTQPTGACDTEPDCEANTERPMPCLHASMLCCWPVSRRCPKAAAQGAVPHRGADWQLNCMRLELCWCGLLAVASRHPGVGAGDVQHAFEEVGNRMQASLEQQKNTAMLNIGVGASLDLAEGSLHPHVSTAGPALDPSK